MESGHAAEALLADLFKKEGWTVEYEPRLDPHRADLVVRKGRYAYVVEAKAASEARSDRIIPLLSQAILQAQAYAHGGRFRPLAVVVVEDAPRSLIDRVQRFSASYAPGLAIGVVSRRGVRSFVGDGLEELDADLPDAAQRRPVSQALNIFSDLNQWLLKVLLAPEIPEKLLSAPRKQYRNASELAAAANASVMSAFRFIDLLRRQAFVEEMSPHLKLVRRAELFRRWRAAALRSPREMPLRFVVSGDIGSRLRSLVSRHQACLGLFAAAEALRLGHVHGVPPHVYVRNLPRLSDDGWRDVVPPSPGESPHLILRYARAPRSVFRGAVHVDGLLVSDIVQVWLDVSAHPSRGAEQAEFIEKRVLGRVIEGSDV